MTQREGTRIPGRPDDSPVSLIICTRNRPRLLSETVDSVLSGDLLPAEIVILDQSDSPHSSFAHQSALDGCRVRYFHSSSRGLSRARNEAVALAQHERLVFTDDDVLLPASWLSTILGALDRGGPRAIVTGRVLPEGGGRSGGFVPTLKGGDTPVTYSGQSRVDPLVTFNMALYRQAFFEVGGFDEQMGPGTSFPAGEDNEFAHRVLQMGYQILYAPEVVVYHRAWRAAAEYLPLRWGYGRGQGAFFAKHLSLRDHHMLRRLLGTLVHVTARAPRRLIQRQMIPGRQLPRKTLAAGEIAFVGGVLAGMLEWLFTVRFGNRSRATRLRTPESHA